MNTWRNLRDLRRIGAAISEDSVTDMLLLEMSRRTKLLVWKRYTRQEEHNTSGADWLWWFVSGNGRRGFPILVQAKRLHIGNRYKYLRYQRRSRTDQTNTLLRYAKQNQWLPLFNFYNYWDSNFPAWSGGPDASLSPLWGCATASAETVKQLLLRHGSDGNKIAHVGSKSFPWMNLVCPALHSTHLGAIPALPDFVCERAKMIFNPRKVPPVTEEVPREVLNLLQGETTEGEIYAPEITEFLKGIIVVSDRPIREARESE